MGGGFGAKGTSFGNTKGSALDAISNLLAVASFIPGIDTFTNLASIPVDLLRGDYISAGLDFVGAIPFIGEVADVAKTADKVSDTVKAIDKIADASKGAKKVSKSSNFAGFSKKIHVGKQGKHIIGHNNYVKGKSILNISTEAAQKLINKFSGTGKKIGTNREKVNFKRIIGKYVDPITGKKYDTTVGTIHYSKSGTHIVPEKPINWRK